MATSTIGTAARDFSTITLWEAALGVGSQIGECYDDSEFDEEFTIDDPDPDDVTLTVAAGERHDGTSGTGARLVNTASRKYSINRNAVTVSWLEFDWNGNDAASGTRYGLANTTGNTGTQIDHILIHDIVGTLLAGIFITAADIELFRCVLYALDQNAAAGSADMHGVGFNVGAALSDHCTSTTIHDVTNSSGSGDTFGISLLDDASGQVQNTVATDCVSSGTNTGSAACISPSSFSAATASHNASSDLTASGTGSLTEISAADQYVSTVGGSEDLHLKSGADLIDAGTDLVTTPSGVEIDIDGRDVDAEADNWDIGADELVAVAATAFMRIVGPRFSLAGVGGLAG